MKTFLGIPLLVWNPDGWWESERRSNDGRVEERPFLRVNQYRAEFRLCTNVSVGDGSSIHGGESVLVIVNAHKYENLESTARHVIASHPALAREVEIEAHRYAETIQTVEGMRSLVARMARSIAAISKKLPKEESES